MTSSLAKEINVQPQVLNLALYAGDGFSFRLICTDKEGAPVDITGTVTAQIREKPTTLESIVDFTAGMLDAYQGIVVLSLTGDQTRDLSESPSSKLGKFSGSWDVQWTPAGSEPRTLCQGKVECVSDVTR